jgi:ABC-type amino acid transport substrate-binding protein
MNYIRMEGSTRGDKILQLNIDRVAVASSSSGRTRGRTEAAEAGDWLCRAGRFVGHDRCDEERRTFKKHGLDVDLVFIPGSGVLTAAMVSGQVPLTFLAGAATVTSAIGGADTVLLSCAINTLFWRLFSVPEITTVAGLKGKRIGVTRLGTLEDGILRYVLKERGLNPEREVSFIAVGPAPQRVAALSKGIIEAASFIPPQASLFTREAAQKCRPADHVGYDRV